MSARPKRGRKEGPSPVDNAPQSSDDSDQLSEPAITDDEYGSARPQRSRKRPKLSTSQKSHSSSSSHSDSNGGPSADPGSPGQRQHSPNPAGAANADSPRNSDAAPAPDDPQDETVDAPAADTHEHIPQSTDTNDAPAAEADDDDGEPFWPV